MSDDQVSIQSDQLTISSPLDTHWAPVKGQEKKLRGNLKTQQRREIQRGMANMMNDLMLENLRAEANN
jgi:hypothetical protein